MIKTMYGKVGLQIRRAQDPLIRFQPHFQGTQKRYGSKNLLQRAILCRRNELLLSREDWSFKLNETICKNWSVFFIDNFGLTNSFGLGMFVELEIIILDQGILVRSLGKSTRESSMWIKVNLHMIKWRISRFRDISGIKNELRGAKSRVDAQY